MVEKHVSVLYSLVSSTDYPYLGRTWRGVGSFIVLKRRFTGLKLSVAVTSSSAEILICPLRIHHF